MSTIAATVAAVFVLSAVVAGTGFPGMDSGDSGAQVVLSDPATPSGVDAGRAVVVAEAPPIVLGGAPGTRPTAEERPRRRSAGDGESGVGAAPEQTATVAVPAAAAGDDPARAPARPQAGQPAGGAGEAIRDGGQHGGNAVDTFVPGAGEPVRDATGAVADTVEQAGAGTPAQGVTDAVAGAPMLAPGS